MCAGAGRSGQRGSAAASPGRRRGARARKHVGAKPNHVGLGREARAAAAPRLRAADRSPLRRLRMTAKKALRPWPRRSAARTWTFGASSRGKSPPSRPAPPAGTLAPSAWTAPAKTNRAGARRRRRSRHFSRLEPSMRCGGADLGGCQCSDGLSGGYRGAACPRQASEVRAVPSGASMQHHSRLPLTAAPPRRALVAWRAEGKQPLSAPKIPAEPPPHLARGTPRARGPLQQRKVSLRAPGRSLCTLITSQRGTAKHSRSTSPGPAQRGACTYERWNGAGHRPR